MNLKISYLVLGLGIIPTFSVVAHAENPGYVKDETSYTEIINICNQLVAGTYPSQSAPCPDLKCDDTSTSTKLKDLVKAMKKCYKPNAEFKENDIVGKIRELCNDKAINCTVEGGILSKEKTYSCFDANKTAYKFTYKDKLLESQGSMCQGCIDTLNKIKSEGENPTNDEQICRWSFVKVTEKDVVNALVKQVGGEKKKYQCNLTIENNITSDFNCSYDTANPMDVRIGKSKDVTIKNIQGLKDAWLGATPTENESQGQQE